MGLLKNRINQEWNYQGLKHLGVTETEYGSRLGYRAQTVFGIAETAVLAVLGLETHVSETNRQKALDAAQPRLKET